jgi:site-specific recombinase XerD
VDRLLRAKADAGMARSSVKRLRSILTDALTHAERRQLVARNAGRLSIMPSITESEEQRALTEAERERFIATAIAFHPAKQDEDGRVTHRLAALMAVIFHVGLRPGEGTGQL